MDSLGFNEQELNFAAYVNDDEEDIELDAHPTVEEIIDMMTWLIRKYGQSPSRPSSRLTRLHFHSITHHVIATADHVWENTRSAVAAGTRIAGSQACDIVSLDSEKLEYRIAKEFRLGRNGHLINFNPEEPVVSWRVDHYNFVFSPVLICKKPVKTVGLGDAISATGLLYSSFNVK